MYKFLVHVYVSVSKHHVKMLVAYKHNSPSIHIVSVHPSLTALRITDAQVSGSLSSSFDGLGL